MHGKLPQITINKKQPCIWNYAQHANIILSKLNAYFFSESLQQNFEQHQTSAFNDHTDTKLQKCLPNPVFPKTSLMSFSLYWFRRSYSWVKVVGLNHWALSSTRCRGCSGSVVAGLLHLPEQGLPVFLQVLVSRSCEVKVIKQFKVTYKFRVTCLNKVKSKFKVKCKVWDQRRFWSQMRSKVTKFLLSLTNTLIC